MGNRDGWQAGAHLDTPTNGKTASRRARVCDPQRWRWFEGAAARRPALRWEYQDAPGRQRGRMSKKTAKIAALIEDCRGRELDARYLGYFKCFNQGLYYEAHDVLEELWLAERRGPAGSFYKGLIQLAGAFVHVQKGRPGPAAALLKLARGNLQNYPAVHQRLSLGHVLGLIDQWLGRLEGNHFGPHSLSAQTAPRLVLLEE
jgi:predicted metal-dependent hydrolase